MAAGYRGKITLPQHVPHTLNTLDGNGVRELWTTPSHLCKVLHCFVHASTEVSHGLRVGLTFVVAPVCRLLLCMFVQTLDCRTRSQFSCGSVGSLREQVLSWLQNGRWGGKLVSFRSTPWHSLGRPEFDRSSLGVRTVQAKPAQQPGESDSLAVTTWVVFVQWGRADWNVRARGHRIWTLGSNRGGRGVIPKQCHRTPVLVGRLFLVRPP
jgi:hypothetical protein